MRYKPQGVGTVSFQRESGKPLRFNDVLCSRVDQEPQSLLLRTRGMRSLSVKEACSLDLVGQVRIWIG
jgi:hypothetical protein